MKLQLVRHATLWLEYAGVRWLVDPMFSGQGDNPPVRNSPNDRRNPLVPLPGPAVEWAAPDAVLVTHRHPDHWDPAAVAALPKAVPLFGMPSEVPAFEGEGFTEMTGVEERAAFRGITIHRTSGRHGTGEIGRLMGAVAGFVLQAEGEPTVYIAGDTIWCEEVRQALDRYRPEITVVNAGGARFNQGDAITMTPSDVAALCRFAPYTKVAAVHMEAINHCLVTREDLSRHLRAEGLEERVHLPGDGEWMEA